MNRRFPAPVSSLSILVVVMAGSLLASAASAQPERFRGRAIERTEGPRFGQSMVMPGRFQHLLEPDYRMRDAALLRQQLGLHNGQEAIVQFLIEDYRAAFEEAAEPLRDAMRRVRRPAGMRFPGGFARGGGMESPGPMQVFRLDGVDAGEVEIAVEGLGDAIRSRIEARMEAEGSPPMIVIERLEGERITLDSAGLSDEARERMEELVRRMEERFAQRREAMERRLRRVAEREAENDDRLEASEVASIARDFLAKKDSLRTNFENDIQAVLGPDQLESWPEAKALVRRVNQLQLGRLSGEQVDLNAVARDIWFPEFIRDRIDPHLEQYVSELDATLADRARLLDRMDIELFEAVHEQDWDRVLQIDERVATRRLAVRNVNEHHAEVIAAAIEPHEWREKFSAEVRARTYPWLDRPTPFTRSVERTLSNEELTDEQREAIEDLIHRYEVELAQADERTISELRESEHLRNRHMIEMMQRLQEGEAPARGDFRGMMTQFNPRHERTSVAMRYLGELRNLVPAEMLGEMGPYMLME